MANKLYCMYGDPMGLSTLLIVYASMLIGQVLFVYSVCWPVFSGNQKNPGIVFSMVIELVIFEILWVMMVWSHCATMMKDPGFIPKRYEYDVTKTPKAFELFKSF